MDPELRQRIQEAFTIALGLPPEERAEWLSITLPADPFLASEVRKLLAGLSEVKDQLDGKAARVAVGMRVGPYRVLSELGHGGMGAVYLAVRDDPSFTQKVALKLIKRGMDTDEIVRRFVAERQILASLAHPNIARLFDGGSTPEGRPYFVMEYVEGRPITAYARELKLSIEDRLRLVLRVCRAVQHAHQSLVVHRDLKPANILVDAEGEPKLLDFGIAKLLDPRSSGGMDALTGLEPGPMTPDYASPEQKSGGPVTTATDVYGLGLLLYELLVGLNPRAAERKLGEGWSSRPPSQALVALAEPGDAETRRLARRVAGDLDTIAGKALEPEPERRYGTAAALAEDVERHLTQRPVAARRPTLAYRLSRTLVRYKLAASLALVVCLLAAFALYFAIARSQERDRAEAQRQIARTLDDFLTGMIERADPEKTNGETLTVRQVLDAGAPALLVKDARSDPEVRAALLETTGTTYGALGLDEKAQGYLEQALKLRDQQRSPSPTTLLATAGTWTLLGDVASSQGKYDLSRRSYQRAIAIREEQSGPAALPLVTDWNGLGLVALDEGDLAAAERYFTKSLAVSRVAEDGQRELAETLNDLGKLAALRSKFTLAQLRFQEAWHYFRSTLGDDNPDTISARSNLAFALANRAEYAAAETLYKEIVESRRRLMGPDHPALARTLLDLSIAQRERGRLAEARATLDEVLRIRREHRLPLDEGEAETWRLVGHVELDQNQLDAAEADFQKSFDIYQSLHGDRRPILALVLNSQAQVRRRRGDLAGAVALARRGLELTRAATGETSPSAANSLKRLAELLQQDRQFQEAEMDYRQALKLLSGPEWKDHPDRARVEIGFGSLLVETGRAGDARPYLKDGLSIQRKALLFQDPTTAKAESELGACYSALSDPQAGPLLQHGYQSLLALRGPDHPDTRVAMERWRRFGATAR